MPLPRPHVGGSSEYILPDVCPPAMAALFREAIDALLPLPGEELRLPTTGWNIRVRRLGGDLRSSLRDYVDLSTDSKRPVAQPRRPEAPLLEIPHNVALRLFIGK